MVTDITFIVLATTMAVVGVELGTIVHLHLTQPTAHTRRMTFRRCPISLNALVVIQRKSATVDCLFRPSVQPQPASTCPVTRSISTLNGKN